MNTMNHPLNGRTFPFSEGAGNALERSGYRYVLTDMHGAVTFYRHVNGTVALVDNGCNQAGYKIEVTNAPEIVQMVFGWHRD